MRGFLLRINFSCNQVCKLYMSYWGFTVFSMGQTGAQNSTADFQNAFTLHDPRIYHLGRTLYSI
jgi:hypothetical protein